MLHNGSLALSDVERNGITIDSKYLNQAMQKAEKRIERGYKKLKESKVFEAWKDHFKGKTNIDSNPQLGTILFDVLGHESKTKTRTGRPSTNIEALEELDISFVRNLLRVRKLKKAFGTYLKGIAREKTSRELLHTMFNLHTTKTYRSSSDSPNFQNIPIRDPKVGALVRQAFVARPGHRLVEIDYGSLEVRVATCYHKDPNMIEEINDPKKDMHRDMTAKCFKCKPEQVTKVMRDYGKNMFVFPEFYGSFWRDCAENLWEATTRMKLELTDGTPVKEHLRKKGIKSIGETESHYDTGRIEPKSGFYKHISEVEYLLWERFPVYKQWRVDWWEEYLKNKEFTSFTGFTYRGYMQRNDVVNYAVQGAAFHCLLWSMIQINQEIKQRKMKAKIVGQIHDSIIADVPEYEVDEYLILAEEIMCHRLLEEWSWIIVPLEIEAEVTPIGGSWFDKKEVPIPK